MGRRSRRSIIHPYARDAPTESDTRRTRALTLAFTTKKTITIRHRRDRRTWNLITDKSTDADVAMIEARFDELDVNDDGRLSIEDLIGDMDQLAADLAKVLRAREEETK